MKPLKNQASKAKKEIKRDQAIYTIFLSAVMIFLFNGCHSKNITIKTTYSSRYAWNNDNSAFAFVAINEIYRNPVGIAKFPDGGTTLNVYRDRSLYYYEIDKKQLHRIANLNIFNILYPKNSAYRFTYLLFDNALIYYKLPDADEYAIKMAKKHIHNQKDLDKLKKTIEDVSKIYVYNIDTKQTSTIHALPKKLKWTAFNYDYLKDLRKAILDKISYSEWGVILKEIYPQSKDAYMEYIIKNSANKNTMRAIYEQFVPSLTQKDKRFILKKMDNYAKELYNEYRNNNDGVYQESLKKTKYENYLKYLKKVKKAFSL